MVTTNYTSEAFAFLSKTKKEFQDEYNAIPNAQAESSLETLLFPGFSDGVTAMASVRNRYANIIANNETRVKLQGRKADDDYINANYCLNGRVIIAQGPLADGANGYTRHHEDFYDMIFHENATAILMLTGYIEDGRIKCSEYLSDQFETDGRIKDGSGRKVGKYTVIVKNDDSPEAKALNDLGFRVTKVFISRVGEQQTRIVTHYHLPSWEDHGGSSGKTALTAALILLNEGKTVVHCSAGIGRSGTAATLAASVQKIQLNQVSDTLVVDSATALRSERRGLIQTDKQYITVYEGIKTYVEDNLKLTLPPTLKPEVSSATEEAVAVDSPEEKQSKEVRVITVKCKIPEPYSLTIRGNGCGLNWESGELLDKVDDETYTYPLEGAAEKIEYKILFEDRDWESGPNHTIESEETQEIAASFVIPRTPIVVDLETDWRVDYYIRGTGPGMSWDKGIKLDPVKNCNGYVLKLNAEFENFEFKILKNDDPTQWEIGPNHIAEKGKMVRISPEFA